MVDLNKIELDDVELEDRTENLQQEYELGEIVEVEDEGPGIIAAYTTSSFEYPVGTAEDEIEEVDEGEEPEMQEVEASEDNPVYIVALQDGGSVAATTDEISSDSSLEGDDGDEIESWEEVTSDGNSADLADVYSYMDDPSSIEELREAKRKMIHEEQASTLAEYVEDEDMTVEELGQFSYEELVNIRGVDDPHVGFDELPPGWTRKSVLQAWASLGGMWRTCYPRMVRVRGPNFAKRWCSALKDEVLRTEEWRGKF